nr:hypothetical protein [Tanacetum cinerariifolium]
MKCGLQIQTADEAGKSKSSSEVVTKEASTEIGKEKILIKKNICSPGRWIEPVETPSAPPTKMTIKKGPKRTTLRLSFD